MTQHDPARMRPAWGATSSCTRCGNAIAWKGKWVDQGRQMDSLGADVCITDGKWSRHRSATAGTPPGYTVAKAGLRPDDGDLTAMIDQRDARLIAAAPDLLAALREIETWLLHSHERSAQAALRLARAAIARAEGDV